MSQEPNQKPTSDPSRKRMFVIVAAMLTVWCAAIYFRQEIRVRWWGHQLQHTSDTNKRMYYLHLLMSTGDAAVVVAERLLSSDEPGERSLGAAILHTARGDRSTELLIHTCNDPDWETRKSAIAGLSLRKDTVALDALRNLADHADVRTAMFAVDRLLAVNSPEALMTLRSLALNHEEAGVRAQAIVSLTQDPSPQTIATLIECLNDEGCSKAPLATEQNALESLHEALGKPIVPAESQGSIFGYPSNMIRAAVALRTLTGEEFGFIEASPEDRAESVTAWRHWYNSQN